LEVRGDPDDFNPIFEALRKKEEQNKALVNAIQNVINNLKNDQTIGDHVRRNQIPRYYIQKHDVQTLFRVELPRYWRLTYAILSLENHKKCAVILEVFDHDAYNKRFGYFKK